jgi:O-antigen/teichoic acid export membrane protein
MLELIKAVLKTGSASIANLLISTVTVKIIALITGPAGVGVWSLLRQCQQSAVTIGTGNGGTSFVRGINQLDGSERSQFIRTVATTYLFLGCLVVIGMMLLSGRLAVWVGSVDQHVILLLALPVAAGILREYLNSLLNGMRAIGRMAVLQIIGPLSALVIAYPAALMVANGNYAGFILMMLSVALVTSAVSMIFIRRADWAIVFYAAPFWTSASFKRFAGLASVMAITGIFATLTLFACRVLIARYRGIDEAGYFDVAWSLGLTYVALILNALGTYYLPRLSAMPDEDQAELVRHVSKLAIIGMTPLVVLMILIKAWVVTMFFSTEFKPALQIFQYLLVADYLKISAWVFSMVVVARGLEKPLLFGSIAWDASLLAAVFAITYLDLPTSWIGAAIIGLHLFALIGYYRLTGRVLNLKFEWRLWRGWGGGLICVIATSALMWNKTEIDLSCAWMLVLSFIVPLSCLSKDEYLAVLRQLRKLASRR